VNIKFWIGHAILLKLIHLWKPSLLNRIDKFYKIIPMLKPILDSAFENLDLMVRWHSSEMLLRQNNTVP
jgi:hypothetical protein